jgi:hypothetical protein
MNIYISGVRFPTDIGKRLLKTKYGECRFPALSQEWDDIQPIGFLEIAREIKDIDRRRIAIGCLGVEGILKDVEPVLVASETIRKSTVWVDPGGGLIERAYDDTYHLYKVRWADLYYREDDVLPSEEARVDRYFVKFKDTSTQKDYLIWIDMESILRESIREMMKNRERQVEYPVSRARKGLNPIQAIAWTIRTDLPKGGIEAIVRQGDCVLFRPKPGIERLSAPRPLTEAEYRELMLCES